MGAARTSEVEVAVAEAVVGRSVDAYEGAAFEVVVVGNTSQTEAGNC